MFKMSGDMEYKRNKSAFAWFWLTFVSIFISINYASTGRIIEDDIHVEEPIIQTMAAAYTVQEQTTKTWTSGQVPYVFHTSLSQETMVNIDTAMKTIQNITNKCIRFFPRTSSNTDYINITSFNPGCYSSVGRVGRGQIVDIGPGCNTVGIILHELLHALGFWHEQSRADRDQYVKILWDNIQIGKNEEFRKHAVAPPIGYDFKSILHYKYNQFAKVKTLDTIIPNANYSSVSKTELGQRDGLSDKDRQRIMWLYGCDEVTCVRPNFMNVAVSPVQNAYKVGTAITYSCVSGNLYGPKTSECLSNGQWCGEEPKCLKIFPASVGCTPPIIRNVTVIPIQRLYRQGNSITFKCNKGVLIGASKSECMSNGEWSGAKPYCVRSDMKTFHYCDMGDCYKSWYLPSWYPAKWQQHSGSTSTMCTGPNTDHTAQNTEGLYLLMDATGVPRQQFALAISPSVYSGEFNICMTFYYYMYGKDLDSNSLLYVFIDGKYAWHTRGSTKEGKWTKVVTQEIHTTTTRFKAVILARKGNGNDKADVAIDDVFIGPCDDVYQYSNITADTDSKEIEYNF